MRRTNNKDLELSQKAKAAMIAGDFDQAIEYTNQMIHSRIALKMHLLIIEYEKATKNISKQTKALP
jgi:hypothetical protein